MIYVIGLILAFFVAAFVVMLWIAIVALLVIAVVVNFLWALGAGGKVVAVVFVLATLGAWSYAGESPLPLLVGGVLIGAIANQLRPPAHLRPKKNMDMWYRWERTAPEPTGQAAWAKRRAERLRAVVEDD